MYMYKLQINNFIWISIKMAELVAQPSLDPETMRTTD